ncbi:hypothetical protein ScPMuIL_004746 [Solemya velum]
MKQKKQASSYNIDNSPSKGIKTEVTSEGEGYVYQEGQLTRENNPRVQEPDIKIEQGMEKSPVIIGNQGDNGVNDVQVPKRKAEEEVAHVMGSKMKKNKTRNSATKPKIKKQRTIEEVLGMNKLVETIRDRKKLIEKSSEKIEEQLLPAATETKEISVQQKDFSTEKHSQNTEASNEMSDSNKKSVKTEHSKSRKKKFVKGNAQANVLKISPPTEKIMIGNNEGIQEGSKQKKQKKSENKNREKNLLLVETATDTKPKLVTEVKNLSKRKGAEKTKVKNEKDKSIESTKKINKDKIKQERVTVAKIKIDSGTPMIDMKRCQETHNTHSDSTVGFNKGVQKKLGAHVSISGGLKNAVLSAVDIGAKSFAMFLKSQRQWNSKPLSDTDAEKFRGLCEEHGYPPHLILPHGSYLMNCGSPNQETLEKSRTALVDELHRCEKLGLTLFNFHPGSTCGEISVEESLDRIAHSINLAHSQTKAVTCVIENMSCQGNTIGGKFSEIRGIIDRVTDKSRIGVCLDTCHAFAAGYNLATVQGYNEMMDDFEREIGFDYLKGMHINDSKGKVGCHLDRHENIGRGNIGKACFKWITAEKLVQSTLMINQLNQLVNRSVGDKSFEKVT